MKQKLILPLTLAALVLLPSASNAAVYVEFSGGSASPLSFTLPAITWTMTNAADFNIYNIFGIGIALGQTPAYLHERYT